MGVFPQTTTPELYIDTPPKTNMDTRNDGFRKGDSF